MVALLLVLLPLALVRALPHSPQELVPMDRLGDREPSCETLRAMWRYSKRQSRAAQVTNEIPTYRDPFAYSIWDTLQQGGRDGQGQTGAGPGTAKMRSGLRFPPVYGRVVHNTPRWRNTPARGLLLQPMYRGQPHRNARISGGGLPPEQTGSLQRLKEMINQERLRDLQEQRLAEEAVAQRQQNSKPEHYGRVVDSPRPVSSLDLVLASANNNKRGGEPEAQAQQAQQPPPPPEAEAELAPDQVDDDEPW